MKATDSDYFSSKCINVDCSNLHKIHYLAQHRDMYFYRRSKGKLGSCKKETTFKINRETSSNPTELPSQSKPPEFEVQFTIL